MQLLPRGFSADPGRMVTLQNISSLECYTHKDGTPIRRVLEDVSFTVAAGQRFAVLGDEVFDLKLLLDVIGNIKPYESGRCALLGLGMMREKQRILEQVYYVNDQRLLYLHMQGIAWLMLATRHVTKNPIDRQLLWLGRLLELGLEKLCFSHIRNLTPAERVLLALLPAIDMRATLILVDLSHTRVAEGEMDGCARLLTWLTERAGKTVLFATAQRDLADRCATHAALLIEGRVKPEHAGTVEALCDALDHRLYTLRVRDYEHARAALEAAFPGLRLEGDESAMSVYGDKVTAPAPSDVLRALEQANAEAQVLTLSRPSLGEAMKEAMRHAV